MRGMIVPFVFFCFVFGCSKDNALDSKTEKLGRPSLSVPSREKTASQKTFGLTKDGQNSNEMQENEADVTVTGVVKETIDASRYTYLRLQPEIKGDEIWAAIPHADIRVGQKVEIVQSLVMKDFESKTLGRVFPSVVFGVLKSGVDPAAPSSTP